MQIRQLREQWQGNPRLRWGVSVIVAILALYLILMAWDWRQALHAEYKERTLQLYKVQALVGQDVWLQRAQQADALDKAVQAEIPRASSLGLAQAEVQAWARQAMQAFGSRLTSEAPAPVQVAGRPGLWRIPVTLRGVTRPALLLELLRLVEDNKRLMVVDNIAFDQTSGQPLLVMTVVAYYRIVPAKEVDDATP